MRGRREERKDTEWEMGEKEGSNEKKDKWGRREKKQRKKVRKSDMEEEEEEETSGRNGEK